MANEQIKFKIHGQWTNWTHWADQEDHEATKQFVLSILSFGKDESGDCLGPTRTPLDLLASKNHHLKVISHILEYVNIEFDIESYNITQYIYTTWIYTWYQPFV